MSCFKLIKFITEDWFTRYANVTTKLSWKLFTEGIKRPSEDAWVRIDKSVLIKRKAHALLI